MMLDILVWESLPSCALHQLPPSMFTGLHFMWMPFDQAHPRKSHSVWQVTSQIRTLHIYQHQWKYILTSTLSVAAWRTDLGSTFLYHLNRIDYEEAPWQVPARTGSTHAWNTSILLSLLSTGWIKLSDSCYSICWYLLFSGYATSCFTHYDVLQQSPSVRESSLMLMSFRNPPSHVCNHPLTSWNELPPMDDQCYSRWDIFLSWNAYCHCHIFCLIYWLSCMAF